MKRILISIFALGAAALTAFSQGVPPVGSYMVNTLTLPTNIITAAVGGTNITAGWSSIGSVTNTSITFSNTVFVTNSIVVSWTNTLYADMFMAQQKDIGLMISESAGIGTNVYTFARGLDSSTIDTNNEFTVTMGHAAAGTLVFSTNVPASYNGGFGEVRLAQETWTAASAAVTNNYIKWASKRNAW